MYTVKKKPLTPNMIWDAKAGKPLCSFGHKGFLETNDKELVDKLAAMGHTVTGEADAKTPDKMTVEELKAYAAEKNIDLGDASKKANILKVIQEAEKEQ